MVSVELDSEDKTATTGPPVEPPGEPPVEPPGVPPGESPGGAGSLEPVKLESEDKSATTAIAKRETAAAEELALVAGVAQ